MFPMSHVIFPLGIGLYFGNLFQSELLSFVSDEMAKESTSNVGYAVSEHGFSLHFNSQLKFLIRIFYISEGVFTVEVI